MSIISDLTKDCPREDCSLSSRGGTSTQMGWSPRYDKHGNRTDNGDTNIRTEGWFCSTCKREWSVSTQYGKTKISELNTSNLVK